MVAVTGSRGRATMSIPDQYDESEQSDDQPSMDAVEIDGTLAFYGSETDGEWLSCPLDEAVELEDMR